MLGPVLALSRPSAGVSTEVAGSHLPVGLLPGTPTRSPDAPDRPGVERRQSVPWASDERPEAPQGMPGTPARDLGSS
jgi:hypothetical protein